MTFQRSLPDDFDPTRHVGDDTVALRLDKVFVIDYSTPPAAHVVGHVARAFDAASMMEVSLVVTNDHADARPEYPLNVLLTLDPDEMALDFASLDDVLAGQLTEKPAERIVVDIDDHEEGEPNMFLRLLAHPAWKTKKCYLRHAWLKNDDEDQNPRAFRLAVLDIMN